MSDPYKVLGVSPSATEDEIKKAYRELIKKYHPDNYSGSPLEDLASEKMKEVNEAYDEIMKQRKTGGRTYKSSSYGSSTGSNYNDVRNLIRNNRIADAEQILEGVPTSNRDAEWYFLRGTIYYKKGWTEEAYRNFTTAHTMSPNNAEYASVLNQMNSRRRGNFGGYQPNSPNGCTGCDVCSGLLCADCCCECLGGDLIRCC